jgi:hypothetical protein
MARVDGRFDVWICAPCGTAVAWPSPPRPCARCDGTLERLSAPVVYAPATLPIASCDDIDACAPSSRFRRVITLVVSADLAIVLLGVWYVALAFAIVQLLIAVPWPRLPDDLRVVHGLEHATIAILLARGLDVVRGRSSAGWFSITTLRGERTAQELAAVVRESTEDAIRRIRLGERALAYHPRCGARSVIANTWAPCVAGAFALLASLWLAQWLAIVFAVALGAGMWLAAGWLAIAVQRWRTVSTGFADAVVSAVDVLVAEGELAHVVVMVRGSRGNF